MGKRTRRREGEPATAGHASAAPSARNQVARPRFGAEERPKAPWHPFPLVELCTLIGLVLIVIGFFSLSDQRGGVLIVCGLVLGSLAGLDTVVREHFAGYRSHSLLLAGVPTVLVAGVLYFSRAPILVLLVAAAAVFAAALVLFRRTFRRRSGGLAFP